MVTLLGRGKNQAKTGEAVELARDEVLLGGLKQPALVLVTGPTHQDGPLVPGETGHTGVIT